MHYKVRNSSISSGIFLIGLGVLAYSGWWWPGILLVVGLSSSAALIMRGKYVPALLTFGFFAVIPLTGHCRYSLANLRTIYSDCNGCLIIFRSFTNQKDKNKPISE